MHLLLQEDLFRLNMDIQKYSSVMSKHVISCIKCVTACLHNDRPPIMTGSQMIQFCYNGSGLPHEEIFRALQLITDNLIVIGFFTCSVTNRNIVKVHFYLYLLHNASLHAEVILRRKMKDASFFKERQHLHQSSSLLYFDELMFSCFLSMKENIGFVVFCTLAQSSFCDI